MSYRQTRDLKQSKADMATQSKSPTKTAYVAPEDNWELVGNPSVLFDELP